MVSATQSNQQTSSAPKRRALLFLKPQAHDDNAELEDALQRLRGGDIELIEACLDSDTNVNKAISAAIVRDAADIDLVIVGGGDGSIHAAAAGVLESGLPLAILPLGTGNDLARSLGVPLDLAAAAQLILNNQQREIDVGLVNELPFFNVVQLGLSEQVTREMDSKKKQRWGILSYLFGSLRALRKSKPFSLEIVVHDNDGGTTEHKLHALQVSVANGRFFGGGCVIQEGATIDDGQLDLCCLRRRELSSWQLFRLLMIGLAMRSGHQGMFEEILELNGVAFELKMPAYTSCHR